MRKNASTSGNYRPACKVRRCVRVKEEVKAATYAVADAGGVRLPQADGLPPVGGQLCRGLYVVLVRDAELALGVATCKEQQQLLRMVPRRQLVTLVVAGGAPSRRGARRAPTHTRATHRTPIRSP